MKHKKLLPKHHSGKLAHRSHTHYGLLLVVLLLAMAPLMMISGSVAALSADPVSTSESVYAVVPAPVPDRAPVITSISDGQEFTTAELVTISGTCPENTIIKLYKNQVMAGSDFCERGSFSVPIDLFVGPNSIIARAYNINNVAGPDSDPVNVRLSIGGVSNPTNQLFVTSDTHIVGVRTKEPMKWTFVISGGQAPYAVSIGWGDGKTDLVSRGEAGSFIAEHTYDMAGDGYKNSYDVTVQVTDQQGNKAFLHVVSIVSGGQAGIIGSMKAGYDLSGALRIAWQLVILAAAIIVGFWLGEKYESHVLKKKYHLAP